MAKRIYLFKKVVFDCKRATLLSLKREEGTISIPEQIELSWHLLRCNPCRQFTKQSALITEAGMNIGQQMAVQPPFQLSAAAAERIQGLLDKVS